jgi:hypothetical protein
VNYQNETIELRINYGLVPNSNLKVIQDLQNGLLASRHSAEWGLSDELGHRNRKRDRRDVQRYAGDENVPMHVWPGTSLSKHYWVRKNFVYSGIAVVFHLINNKGKTIATFNTGAEKMYLINDIIWNNHEMAWERADYDVGYGRILPDLRPRGSAVFNPKVDDVTDGLTIQVATILGKNGIGEVMMQYSESVLRHGNGMNGVDYDITGYIRISAGGVR